MFSLGLIYLREQLAASVDMESEARPEVFWMVLNVTSYGLDA